MATSKIRERTPVATGVHWDTVNGAACSKPIALHLYRHTRTSVRPNSLQKVVAQQRVGDDVTDGEQTEGRVLGQVVRVRQ